MVKTLLASVIISAYLAGCAPLPRPAVDITGHAEKVEARATAAATTITETGKAITADATAGKAATPAESLALLTGFWDRLIASGQRVTVQGGEVAQISAQVSALKGEIQAEKQRNEATEKALADEREARAKENSDKAKRWERLFAAVVWITLGLVGVGVAFAAWFKEFSIVSAIATGGVAVIGTCLMMGEFAEFLHKYFAWIVGGFVGVCVLWILVEGAWRAKKNKTTFTAGIVAAIKTSPVQDVADAVTGFTIPSLNLSVAPPADTITTTTTEATK